MELRDYIEWYAFIGDGNNVYVCAIAPLGGTGVRKGNIFGCGPLKSLSVELGLLLRDLLF
jgi:hypothetical protein